MSGRSLFHLQPQSALLHSAARPGPTNPSNPTEPRRDWFVVGRACVCLVAHWEAGDARRGVLSSSLTAAPRADRVSPSWCRGGAARISVRCPVRVGVCYVQITCKNVNSNTQRTRIQMAARERAVDRCRKTAMVRQHRAACDVYNGATRATACTRRAEVSRHDSRACRYDAVHDARR